MSLAITHFVIGTAITGTLVVLVAPRIRFSRTISVLGGIWAMLPDAYWVLPVAERSIRALHDSWFANLFWFHGWLDAVDEESRVIAGVATFALLGLTVVQELIHDHVVRSGTGQFGSSNGDDPSTRLDTDGGETPETPLEAAGRRIDRRKLLITLGSGALIGSALWATTRQEDSPPVPDGDGRAPITDREDDLGETQGTLWSPDVEYRLESSSWTGNPFDVRATVTYTHQSSGETITSGLFYDGGDAWRLRFTGTRTGTWTFTTHSEVTELDGRTGRIVVRDTEEQNGFLTNYGTKWGWEGSETAFVPQLAMYAAPDYFHDRPNVIEADIETLIEDHGFNGFHVYSVADGWTNLPHAGKGGEANRNPDPRTFEALEVLLTRVYQAGGMVHIWAWGDREREQTPPGGKNSPADKRLQRYIAARLGPMPGWSMGYGFDLNEWVSREDILEWHEYMHDQFGWDHYLGGRPRGPNDGDGHAEFESWNRPLDYSSYEHHQPGYEAYVRACSQSDNQPVFSEDRFRINDAEKAYDMEMTRRGLYQSTMAGGVANIWGYLRGPHGAANAGKRPSGAYPDAEVLKTYSTFFFERDRFTRDHSRAEEVSDGVALKDSDGHLIVYSEQTDAITLDLSGVGGAKSAVAVDTASAYQERPIGSLPASEQVWVAPYESDWILAIGE